MCGNSKTDFLVLYIPLFYVKYKLKVSNFNSICHAWNRWTFIYIFGSLHNFMDFQQFLLFYFNNFKIKLIG